MVMPKHEINEIKFKINDRLLGVEQYEFICLRLIDSVKQLEEQNQSLKQYIKNGLEFGYINDREKGYEKLGL